jgi:hypothetical protein
MQNWIKDKLCKYIKMRTTLYIFLFFITVHSSTINRIFKYNANYTINGSSKEPIVSCESKAKTSGSKNKPSLISEIIQNMLYLL